MAATIVIISSTLFSAVVPHRGVQVRNAPSWILLFELVTFLRGLTASALGADLWSPLHGCGPLEPLG